MLAGAADDVDPDGAAAELVAEGLGVVAGVVVELEVPPQAARPARRTAAPSAWTGRRIDTREREIVMNPQCAPRDETTMREDRRRRRGVGMSCRCRLPRLRRSPRLGGALHSMGSTARGRLRPDTSLCPGRVTLDVMVHPCGFSRSGPLRGPSPCGPRRSRSDRRRSRGSRRGRARSSPGSRGPGLPRSCRARGSRRCWRQAGG